MSSERRYARRLHHGVQCNNDHNSTRFCGGDGDGDSSLSSGWLSLSATCFPFATHEGSTKAVKKRGGEVIQWRVMYRERHVNQ